MMRLSAMPLAGVILIVAALAASRPYSPRGLFVHVGMNTAAGQATSFCENRSVVAEPIGDRTVLLNEYPFERAKLDEILEQVYRTRDVRLIYVKASPAAPFHEVATLIDIVSPHVDYVLLMTPYQEEHFYCPSLPLSPPGGNHSRRP